MPNTQIEYEEFVDIRPCLHQVINVLELIYSKGDVRPSMCKLKVWPEANAEVVSEELSDLEYSPDKSALIDQLRIVWNQIVERKMSAVWFIRTHEPVTTLFSAICEVSEVAFARILDGELTDHDFASITSTVGKLAGSRLKICDARQPDMFRNGLKLLGSDPVDYAICDWVLDEEELAQAHYITQNSQTLVLFPCSF